MNKKIKEALQEVEPKVFYGIGRFQNRNNWDCIVYGRRRKGKTESRAGVIIRYFVAIVKEEEIPEGMEEKVLQAMKKVGFDKSNTETKSRLVSSTDTSTDSSNDSSTNASTE